MILIWPNKKLQEPCLAVTDPLNPEFLNVMHTAMLVAGGVGLAAPQVGVLQRFFVADLGEGLEVYVNPTWKPYKTDQDRFLRQEPKRVLLQEGCLSFPGTVAKVARFAQIQATWLNQNLEPREGVLSGLRAQVFQHETEHLDGVVFIKHLTSAERSRILGNLSKARRQGLVKP